MKTFKIYGCLFLAFISFKASAQKEKDTIVKYINTKTYVLSLREIENRGTGNVTPLMQGRHLLTVTPDSIMIELPDFSTLGFDAPGIQIDNRPTFVSKRYTYKTKDNKNGTWNIYIDLEKPPGSTSKVNLLLRIDNHGYTTLNVNRSTKPTAVYNGYLYGIDEKL